MKNNTNVRSRGDNDRSGCERCEDGAIGEGRRTPIDASRAWCARRFAATSEVDRRDGVSPRHTADHPGSGERPRPVDRRDQTGGAEQNGKMKIGATHVRKPIETMTSMTASTTLAVICS